jgi:hypothetical protein
LGVGLKEAGGKKTSFERCVGRPASKIGRDHRPAIILRRDKTSAGEWAYIAVHRLALAVTLAWWARLDRRQPSPEVPRRELGTRSGWPSGVTCFRSLRAAISSASSKLSLRREHAACENSLCSVQGPTEHAPGSGSLLEAGSLPSPPQSVPSTCCRSFPGRLKCPVKTRENARIVHGVRAIL